MRGCEVIWGAERADEVQAMVEKATDDACPCMKDQRCPLLGDALDRLVGRAASLRPPIAPGCA